MIRRRRNTDMGGGQKKRKSIDSQNYVHSTDLICCPLEKVNQIDIFLHPHQQTTIKNYTRLRHGVGDLSFIYHVKA